MSSSAIPWLLFWPFLIEIISIINIHARWWRIFSSSWWHVLWLGHLFPLFLTSLMKVEQHVLMEEIFCVTIGSYLFYFRPHSSMDILRKIVFKKLKLKYYLVELLPYFFIRWGTCLTTFDIMSTLDLLIRLINYRLCIHNNFHFQMLVLYYLILAPI